MVAPTTDEVEVREQVMGALMMLIVAELEPREAAVFPGV